MRVPPALVAAGLALVVAVDVGAVLLHDDATPYTAQQALEQFRAEATASPSPSVARSAPAAPARASTGPAAARPARGVARAPVPVASPTPAAPHSPAAAVLVDGVYSYATSGHEEVDLLGGSRHDYPAETSMTYRRSGCGEQVRWQPLEERYSVDDLCTTAAGGELRRAFQRHSFFGQSDDEDLRCDPGLVFLPAAPRPGQVSTGTCRSDSTTVALRFEVRDVSRMSVGGRSVEVVHLLTSGRISGAARGETKREEWLTRSGLLVRAVAAVDSDRDTPGGTAHYTESYDLRLRSLDPVS